MAISDVIAGANLGDSFDLSNGTSIELKLGANLSTAVDGTINASGPGSLATTSITIYQEQFAGGSNNGVQSGAWDRNSSVTRLSTGQWRVVFATPHPDGADYHVDIQTEEAIGTRDTPDPTVTAGTKTANGFDFMITTGDNGGTADTLVDAEWSYGVSAPLTVLTAAAIV